MYYISLHEQNKKWRLILHFKNYVKAFDYSDLESAIKNLKRAIEIRNKFPKGVKK